VAEGVQKPEGTIRSTVHGQGERTPPGSESMACTQSSGVNVGDPHRSSREGSIGRQVDQ